MGRVFASAHVCVRIGNGVFGSSSALIPQYGLHGGACVLVRESWIAQDGSKRDAIVTGLALGLDEDIHEEHGENPLHESDVYNVIHRSHLSLMTFTLIRTWA